MNHVTQGGAEGGDREVHGRAAGDAVDGPRPQADDGGRQAVDEAQQLIGRLRRILGQSAVVPNSPHQRRG
jgi:hypothetical protein